MNGCLKLLFGIVVLAGVCVSAFAMEAVAITPAPAVPTPVSSKIPDVRVYQVSNDGGDMYSLNQARTEAFCDEGDVAIGGGGACPRCDSSSNPACGRIVYDLASRPIEAGGKSGWRFMCDVGAIDPYHDTASTYVVCLDNRPYR